jgi:uncharacterized protein (DUF2141 family)
MKIAHSGFIKLILITLFSYSLIVAQNTTDSIQVKGKLIVKISGINNNDGDCWFALDKSKETYEREDTMWIGKILPIENKQVTVIIDSLKYGEYAVRVFHDENRNGKLDTNLLGIPTEDYGYSNNVSGFLGPPSWEKAKFIFDKPEMTIEIKID